MSTIIPRTCGKRDGFSLVEVALALLVVAIGLLTVIGLFPTGMEANRLAIDDTQLGLFAEDVFNGMRNVARKVGWANFTDGNAIVKLPITAPEMWEATGAEVTTGSGRRKLTYVVRGNPGLEDLNVQYELRILDLSPNRKGIQLNVWNGLYASSTTSQVFYSELYRYE